MRIGIYKDTLANRRGADVAVLAFAKGLLERGHEAVVFEKPELMQRLNEKWDVIISTGTNELLDLDGYEAAPIVQQFHTDPNSAFKWKRFSRNRRIRAALSRVAAIQVLRKAHLPYVEGYGPPSVVIGNWSAYNGENLNNHPAAESKTILYPAAFSKSKNHKLLLEAFSLLKGEFPDWTLELYGNGRPPDNLPLNVKVMEYGDLSNAYAKCAFLAFPSVDEGFGLVIAEAASFDKPAVMVRDWIGTAEAMGALVTAPTVECYAEGLRQLMKDAPMRRRMGENARSFCEAEYSREKILDQWEALLLHTVNTRIASVRLGIGTRRACYGIDGSSMCIKGYRTDDEISLGMYYDDKTTPPLRTSVVNEIHSARFDRQRNTCSQEWRYWKALKKHLPANVMAAFPDSMYRILDPVRGWCCVEELVRNSDDSPVKSFADVWRTADQSERNLLYDALNKLEDDIVRHAIRIYDPQNILVQCLADGSFRLRIMDFEPGTRTFIPLDALSPVLVRLKVRRRFARYKKNNGIHMVRTHLRHARK